MGRKRWYRQTKVTKCGETGGRESERLIVPSRPGNHSEGPGGGKGAPCHETAGGKHGGCIETHHRGHETTTDRKTGRVADSLPARGVIMT